MKKILRLLKHTFVPHDENDYKPHFFREVGVSMLLFVSVFLLGSSAGSSFFIHKTVLGAEVASSVLIDLTNESRLENNQSPLLRNPKLDKAAELKGLDMADKEYFSHNSPEGVTPWHWFKEVGYTFLYAGENLAINFTDSSDVEKAWLNSPTHRANIMNVEFREIGMATVKGTYKNFPTIYIVQMFGTPAYGKTAELKNIDTVVQTKTYTKIAATRDMSTSTEEGDVKGVSLKVGPTSEIATSPSLTSSATTSTSTSVLEKMLSTQDMSVVKNTSIATIPGNVTTPVHSYSTWYEKVLFNTSYYIDFIYKALLLLVAFALVTMVLVEIRKQHYIHILYGVSLLLLLTLFIYINQSFF
jgi:hypothetical protein